ncbi:dynamin family protein [Pseudomassariella vexata]|uniref:Dynamin family protein n=1 Tax=Pseudomassariella vexata TaxID=1141098 RepID=A0A1Y2DM69_9PEZI|nr:dynamin family protein [Pseudomassariella vexata]ORY60239.1 dynamin family protein [Pseudomassariella vexata]
MVLTTLQTDALGRLCPKDQLELLDSIDRLRLQGINHYISLPQIIVCGDQSSGKSSVLEAISGVSFPIKSNLCTRFPTELVLRRMPQIGSSVSIVPHSSRSDSERKVLASFHQKLDGFDGLADVVESAKTAMGISMHGKTFSKDLLRVEITGPDRPHLTIVDLPGLIHSETKNQTVSDVELIQDVVQTYMKERRSIILAVVSAKNDFANQVVLKLARLADKTGSRTLGVITKPDALIPGSDSEAMYVSLAMNQEVEFRLGWHVLKNMDSETGISTLPERDANEDNFFSQGVWKELSPSTLGINELRSRLSHVLLGQIAGELPSLIDEIEAKSNACHERLEKLGQPRNTLDEQRLYLFHVGQSFQSLVKASIDGSYNDSFFEDAQSQRGYQKRIRAVVQNLNQKFAKDIAEHGHFREVVKTETVPDVSTKVSEKVTPITRDEFITHIQNLIQRTRGRELPGTFNPMIVANLFLEQSRPWEGIMRHHVQKVWDAAKDFLELVVAHIADGSTSKALLQEVFGPALDALLNTLNTKAVELLNPHQNGHPITYNHYFTEALQRARVERRKTQVASTLAKYLGISSDETTTTTVYIKQTVNVSELIGALTEQSEPDMDLFAASEALDCMNAYYKVALKRFIDDVAIEIIETNMISALIDVFSPVSVYGMSPRLVARIAGESKDNATQRENLRKQLDILQKGSDTCKRFIGVRIGGMF